MEKIKEFFTPAVRSRIYEVGIAGAAALGTFGVLTGEKRDALLYVLGAALGLARGNVQKGL